MPIGADKLVGSGAQNKTCFINRYEIIQNLYVIRGILLCTGTTHRLLHVVKGTVTVRGIKDETVST